MLISIVIPTFNSGSYIEQTLQSAINQTYRQTEIICVDNGSSDNTLDIIKSIISKHPGKITLLSNHRRGAPFARNTGLKAARGEWIQFLDSDDALFPEKIEHQVNIIVKKPRVDFIVGSYIIKYASGSELINSIANVDPWLALPQVKLGITSSNLFKREPLMSIGGWKEGLRSSQEYDLMFRLLKEGYHAECDPEQLTVINKRNNSITTTNLKENCVRRLYHLQEIADYFKLQGFGDDYVRTVDQSIFEEIRRIYKFSPLEALQVYKAYFKRTPNLKPSGSINHLYIEIFKLFGFRATQFINGIYHRLILRQNE